MTDLTGTPVTADNLESLPIGTVWVDRDGYLVTRVDETDWHVCAADTGERFLTVSACEILGKYTEDGSSYFLPGVVR